MLDRDNDKSYATVADDDGGNYRDIADIMTELGWSMNHSSARNHVLRAMRKFVDKFARRLNGEVLSEQKIDEIAKDPQFQSGMAEILQTIEFDHRSREEIA